MVGIYLMGFVILVSGLGAMGTAIAYALSPNDQKLALMRPLSLASVFAAICSCSVGLASALSHAADTGLSQQGIVSMVAGLAEAFVPLFVAFAFLAVSWLLVALGLRRQTAR